MSEPDPRRVEEVFDRAIDLEGAARKEYLDDACAADDVLRRAVDALLAVDARFEPTVPQGDRAARAKSAGEPAAIGRFRVVRKLGEGGMGVVYEAHDAALDRRVAVKLVRAGSSDDARARLFREAQAMAKLAHPNVVPVYEVGGAGTQVFVAMELVVGETLSAWLRRDERSWLDVLRMFAGAGRGLAAAHAEGIVHRDFKPDNVLVGRDGRPRVVDFGLARSWGDGPPPNAGPESALDLELTSAGTLLGTPAYMSPEHFNGKGIDPRSDQFAFAVALYRALFKSAPFEGDNLRALCTSVCAGEPTPPPDSDVPPGVVDAVMRGLSRAPDARFPAMEAMLAEIEKPLAVDPDHDPARARRGRRLAVGILAVSAAITISGVGRVEPLAMTPAGILVHGVVALLVLTVLGLAFRKTFLASAHNRRLGLVFALPCAGFVIHRAIALRIGQPVAHTLIGDAMSTAVVCALASMVLERWLIAGTALAILYILCASTFAAYAGIGFGVLVLSLAAMAAWRWGEPKSKWARARDGKSGSSRSRSRDESPRKTQ